MNIKALSKIALCISLLSYNQNVFAEGIDRKPNLEIINHPGYQSFRADVLRKLVNTWCSPAKATLIMDTIVSEGLNTCVEIGVFTGSSFLPIVSSIQYLGEGRAYAIDAWSNEEAVRYTDDEDPNRNWWAWVDMKQAHFLFQNMIRSWDLLPYCTELYTTSEIAVNHIGEIDFLHLDGNYTTEGSLKDVSLYFPKVKMGGCILVSNAHICINHDLPKLDVLFFLESCCQTVGIVDEGNTVLYRKIKSL